MTRCKSRQCGILRKCTGCNEMKEKRQLVRVVKAPDETDENGQVIKQGGISVDLTGKKPGRGAYVCRSGDCLSRAIRQKQLERQLEAKLGEETAEALRQTLAELMAAEEAGGADG